MSLTCNTETNASTFFTSNFESASSIFAMSDCKALFLACNSLMFLDSINFSIDWFVSFPPHENRSIESADASGDYGTSEWTC